ncbi:hypothetical protein FGADI_2330 [Fusarium gaditjirri]|uniref:Uncharacterized protein n=1 Tax=Fusarium gaditjirri TaxID=282569 RepID=A0A8H4TIF0_9HYPO|nr:hypothetical protein FGADI_2330 [Fusarium gaditjirri]
MASSNSITCRRWTHRIRGRLLQNDVDCFRFNLIDYGPEVVIIGPCSGCGTFPCLDQSFQRFREVDQKWQKYRRQGVPECKFTLLFPEGRSQPLTVIEITRCSICRSNTHPTTMCLKIRECFLSECHVCRSDGHGIGGCPEFARMNLTRQVRSLVEDRAGLPPLGKDFPWWDYLHQWMNDPVSGDKIPSGFPWSKKFTEEVISAEGGQYVKRLQAEFNKGFDRSVLPVDESMQTINDVYTNLWCPANIRGWVKGTESSNQ